MTFTFIQQSESLEKYLDYSLAICSGWAADVGRRETQAAEFASAL